MAKISTDFTILIEKEEISIEFEDKIDNLVTNLIVGGPFPAAPIFAPPSSQSSCSAVHCSYLESALQKNFLVGSRSTQDLFVHYGNSQ